MTIKRVHRIGDRVVVLWKPNWLERLFFVKAKVKQYLYTGEYIQGLPIILDELGDVVVEREHYRIVKALEDVEKTETLDEETVKTLYQHGQAKILSDRENNVPRSVEGV